MKKVIFLILFFVPISIFGQSFNEQITIEKDSIGIYYTNVNGELKKIAPIRYYKMKTNALASAFTYGLAGSSIQCLFKNRNSINAMNRDSKIYFYFGDVPENQSATMFMFSSQYSIHDFSICEFKVYGKNRILKSGHVNIWVGTEMGTTETEKVKFKVKKIRDGVYECTLEELKDYGEFCFIFAQSGAGAYGNVFDFSIGL